MQIDVVYPAVARGTMDGPFTFSLISVVVMLMFCILNDDLSFEEMIHLTVVRKWYSGVVTWVLSVADMVICGKGRSGEQKHNKHSEINMR